MTVGSRVAIPLLKAEDVIPHLGRPSHWKEGRSAKSLADCWFNADGLPKSVQVVLASAGPFRTAELIDAWLERKTDLGDGCGAPSQTDLLALLGCGDKTAVLAVEAKVDETFGPFVAEWLADGSLRKIKRLAKLCERLGLRVEAVQKLRYQLLHRFAATLIEAKRFRAPMAILTVQSFCPNRSGFDDFANVCGALGLPLDGVSRLAGPKKFDGISLWTGWIPENHWDGFFERPGSPDFPDIDEKYDEQGKPIPLD